MQTFKKCYSQLFLIAFLLISSLYITACDTSEDDVIINQEPPTEPTGETRDNVTTVSTASNMAAYIVDFPRLFDISQEVELELTTVPRYGTANIITEGVVIYRAFDNTNPTTDEFAYRLNGKDGILKIAYRPDSSICETRNDYYYTTKNTTLYDLNFLDNDMPCDSSYGYTIYIQEIDGTEPPKDGVEIFFNENRGNINYFPPLDFFGKQEFIYFIHTNTDQNYVGVLTFEVGQNTDSTCFSSLQDDVFAAADLPIFISPFEKFVGILENDSTNIPFEAISYEVDSLNFNNFVVDKTYYYLPYLENDSICSYPSIDWELSVDWNGITGGTHALGQYPFDKSVFFVETDTPLPFNFFYTLRNRITGEEHTAEVVVN